uniref:Transposable element protein, putative, Transposase_28 n=1 Tax=Oryza sativa subsp. japonica TaxID=39947 RepID=Q2QWC5_ORYSJ|nr:Transposable element protein, putative, Transposase_28 [Oryza sativa Japonica Group]
MAPRKPNPASAIGPDPSKIDDDTTAYLGTSLVDEDELAKMVTSGLLAENQAFAPGKAVVPKPSDNRTVVFAVFFEAGLRFPCNVLWLEILCLFQVELPQLSPSALVRIAIFHWACRTARFEPRAGLFDAIFYATVNSKTVVTPAGMKKIAFGSVNFNVRPKHSDLWPVNAAMSKWDRHWMSKWFYHSILFEAGSESAKALRWHRRAIAPNQKPKVTVDGAIEARFALLRKTWQVEVSPDEEVDGLTRLIMPEGANTLTLAQADTEARKMIGDVSVAEYSQLLMRQAAGRANRLYDGELPPRAKPFKADGDEGTSRKWMRGQVKLAPRKQKAPAATDSDADD